MIAEPAEMIGTERRRLLFASAIGTIIEWYDFFIFALCIALVFGKTFFPSSDPYAGIILGLSINAVGFLARPLGAIIFGWLGDRVGRKNALVVSLLLMGASTFAMGLLPTYASIGIAAPILLATLRILQGVAVGGEATGALLIVAESMPAKRRAFWTSFPMIGGPAGNVLAALVISTVVSQLGEAGFVEWGWRIPFLLSAVLILVGFWARLRVEESPAFVKMLAERQSVSKAPLTEAIRDYPIPMGQVFLVKAAENTLFYLFTTFFIVLTTQFLGFARGVSLNALLWGSALEVLVIMIAAYVADSIGRKPVMLVGLVAGVLAGFVLFTLEKGASADRLFQVTLLVLSCHGIIVGGMASFFTELFPTRIRYTAMSTSYQLASVLGGSVSPIIGTALLEKTGSPLAVGIYAAIVAVPALICVLLSRETRGTILENIAPKTQA